MRPAHQAREVALAGWPEAKRREGFNEARASSAGSKAIASIHGPRGVGLQ